MNPLNLGIETKCLVLKANSLDPGSEYKVQVTVTETDRYPANTEYIMIVNDPPYDGTCEISPQSGNNCNILMLCFTP